MPTRLLVLTLAWVVAPLAGATATAAERSVAPPSVLVSAEWLAERLGNESLRIVDMTDDRAYRLGHVPRAVHLPLADIMIRHPAGGARLPTVEEAARVLGRLGIEPDTTVVAYDDDGGLNAARLFFTLEALGHERVAVLDGGVRRWRALGLPWTTAVTPVTPTTYAPRPQPARVASAEWVRERLGRPDVAIVDARSPAEYSGQKAYARRGGHIPGAVNIEWEQHLRPDGTFKSPGELRALYAGRGVTPDKTVVTYCQTQHRGAHSYFVLRRLGYPRVVGYDRSWAEWGNRDDLPVEK